MAQDPQIRIKRGETFLLECSVSNPDGSPVDLTGWTIVSQIRDGHGVLISALSVDIHTPAAGQYRLRGNDTDAWPPGRAHMDVAYTDVGGRALTTETVAVEIEHEVTRRP